MKGDLASTAGQVGGRKSRRRRSHGGDANGVKVGAGATAKMSGGEHKTEKMTGGNKEKAMYGGRKSRRKMSTGAKNWVQFVKQVYRTNLAKNPNYKYKQAMKDAAKMKKKNKTMKM
jgi:hypothetical protein